MKVEVVPYCPQWPALFQAEADQLRSLLEVSSLERLDQQNGLLEVMGYEAMGECGISRRRYFRKGGDERTHQIHAFLQGDPHVVRHLAFRDYLRAHPAICREYAALKETVAAQCENRIERYCESKNDFVKVHEARALSWLASRR